MNGGTSYQDRGRLEGQFAVHGEEVMVLGSQWRCLVGSYL